MKFIRILLVLLFPASVVAAMIAVLFYPAWYFHVAIASFILQDVMLFFLFPRQERKADVISITFPIVLQLLLSWAVLFFVEDPYIRYAIAGAHGLLHYIFVWNIYYFLYRFDRYQKRALPHVTSYLSIVNVFYAVSLAYALGFYLDIPIWYTGGPLLVLLLLIILQNLWIHDISVKARWYYVAIVSLVMAQSILVVQLLPSVYFVNALWITIYYYFAVHLGIAALHKELTKREFIRNVIIAGIVVLLVLLTIRWR